MPSLRVVLASLHPRPFSGQIHSLRALANALSAAGDEVRVRTAVLPGTDGRGLWPGAARFAAASLGLIRSLAREVGNADVVHLYLPTPGFSLLADWLAARLDAPLIVGFEAPLIAGDLLGAVAGAARRAPAFYLPRLLLNNQVAARAARHRARAYLVSSQYQRAQLERLGLSGRTAVIPNVVEVQAAGDADPARARQRVGLPADAPLVGYLGHFHPVKGVETLIRAFARLRARAPEARLVLAWSGLGDGAAVARLLDEVGCAEQTIWVGRTSLPDLLRSLTALALPYRYPIGQNAFPNVLLEAHAIGVPLVSTEIPIVAEACRAPETALLVPPGQPEPLAAALGRLIDDAALRRSMVAQQRRRFAERFAPEALDRRYRALYRGALAAAGEGQPAPARGAEAVRLR